MQAKSASIPWARISRGSMEKVGRQRARLFGRQIDDLCAQAGECDRQMRQLPAPQGRTSPKPDPLDLERPEQDHPPVQKTARGDDEIGSHGMAARPSYLSERKIAQTHAHARHGHSDAERPAERHRLAE